jgi:hypothetical protein
MILRTVTWLTFTPRSARSAEIAEHAPAHGFLRGCVAVGGREPVVRMNLPSSAAAAKRFEPGLVRLRFRPAV